MSHPELPPIDVGDREQRVSQALGMHDVDALLITSPTNIRWLTGFAGSAGTVLVHDGEITLFTDSRYTDRAPGELADVASSADIVIARATLGAEVRELAGRAEVVGLEADHVTWAQQQLIDQNKGQLDGKSSRKLAVKLVGGRNALFGQAVQHSVSSAVACVLCVLCSATQRQ